MKYSKQRELIKEVVKSKKHHLTAEEIYLSLKETNPNLSLGTVYRNLNVLSEMQEILRIHMPNGKDIYDGETSPHYHVVCEKCKKIYDINLNLLNNINEEIKQNIGMTVTSHNLTICGICEECIKNNKENEK